MYNSIKIILITIVSLFCNSLHAQNSKKLGQLKIGGIEVDVTIDRSMDDPKYFRINISQPETLSNENNIENKAISIHNHNYEEFIKTLNLSRLKYSEWTKIAKDNNVEYLNKEVAVLKNFRGKFFKHLEIHYSEPIILTLNYTISNTMSDKIEYILNLRSSDMVSVFNKYTKMRGFFLPFKNVQEIDSLLNLISRENVDSFLKSPNVEELFN